MGWLLFGCLGCTADPITSPMPRCEPSAAQEIHVTNRDVYGPKQYSLGYMPYAADGCSLLYVAASVDIDGYGDLRLRDLETNAESIIADATTFPRRPVLAGDWLAWEADVQGRALIHVHDRKEGKTFVIDGAFDHATEPRISTTAVAFTAWNGPDTTSWTDVAMYDLATKEVEIIGQGIGQQRFADISDTHVAWTDFSEDPDVRFDENMSDLADIVIYDRQTKKTTTMPREGKQAFPLLGATGKLAFLDWNMVHPEPKLVAYDLRVADINDSLTNSVLVESVKTGVPYIRPAARGELLEWVQLVENVGFELWRMRADATAKPMRVVRAPSSVIVYPPAASDHITVVGIQNVDGAVALEAFAR